MKNARLADTLVAVSSMSKWLGDGQSSKIKIGHGFATTYEKPLEAHTHLFMAQLANGDG